MRRHDVTTVRHRLPTTLAVSSSGPYPRLKKKTLCGPWAIKKTNGLWWVGVCFWDRRGRAFASLGQPRHSIGVQGDDPGSSERRAFFPFVCGVDILVAFCGVTHSHTLKETPSRPSGGALLLGA